jgi:hypothetical protein
MVRHTCNELLISTFIFSESKTALHDAAILNEIGKIKLSCKFIF